MARSPNDHRTGLHASPGTSPGRWTESDHLSSLIYQPTGPKLGSLKITQGQQRSRHGRCLDRSVTTRGLPRYNPKLLFLTVASGSVSGIQNHVSRHLIGGRGDWPNTTICWRSVFCKEHVCFFGVFYANVSYNGSIKRGFKGPCPWLHLRYTGLFHVIIIDVVENRKSGSTHYQISLSNADICIWHWLTC